MVALELYYQRDYLYRNESPLQRITETLAVRELNSRFLTRQNQRVEFGELTKRS